MKRRNFLKRLPIAAGASLSLNNIPLRVMAEQSQFLKLAELGDNNRVLVILQMHGGNDGLNTIVPVEQYDLYYSRRANIAIPAQNSVRRYIPLDTTLASADQVGLHPDMIDAKDLYDRGRMAIVQGVSYPNNNGSHFRGRDIWHMGGGFDDYFSSGWVGRYLQNGIEPQTYPDDFPNSECPDPLAIEMGSDVSLVFHQNGNIPASISLPGDPESFANLVDSLEGFDDQLIDPRGLPPTSLDNSPYGREMNWILGLEDKTEDYAGRLLEVYQRAQESSVTYPELYPFNAPSGSITNRLSPQFQLIARLLDGGGDGVGTKVFLVRIGGFDTHAAQVESFDPTMGHHAAKLYHITSAIKAFQDDLRARGLEDRVLTMTTSEFGRRVASNGSFGTDHGTGGPMMLFGRGVTPGVFGTNPDVSLNNVEMQFDYRRIYAGILRDWFGVDQAAISDFIVPNADGLQYDPEPVPVAQTTITSTEGFFSDRFGIRNAYPNPAKGFTTISYFINSEIDVKMKLTDSKGSLVKWIVNGRRTPGEYNIRVNLKDLKPGVYFYNIEAGILNETKKLVISN